MKIKMLKGYRGWRNNEEYYPPGMTRDIPAYIAQYLIKNGYAEEQKILKEELHLVSYRDLQAMCKERGLNARGSTEELIARLEG